jgi:hypothetical protein
VIRTCDGNDPNLIRVPRTEEREPCRCGRTFNDEDHSTVWPHIKILTRGERATLLESLKAGIRAVAEDEPS